MALEINNVVIAGNLTRDLELKDTAGGRKVCTIPIANNRTYVAGGNKTQETSFIDVEVWGATAENCSRYLSKGSPIVVIGRLKQERWETQTGEKRSRLKVVAATVQFLSSGNRGQNQNEPAAATAGAAASTGGGDESFDDETGWEE